MTPGIGAKQRFEGKDGSRIVREILMSSPLIRGDEEIASAFQDSGTIEEFHPGGTPLINQGDYESDLFILLCGKVEIQVNGRTVATRGP
ncbi:MAG: hypothetical protein V2A74_05675, partial [bacterium]